MPTSDSKLDTKRSSIRNVLEKTGKMTPKDSRKIEKSIYDMCVNLTKEYEEDSIDDMYNKFAYEKVGEIIHHPDKQKSILDDIKNKVIYWDSVVYEEIRVKERRNIVDQAAGIKVRKGEFKCRKKDCGSDECYYVQSQTRSSDEGLSTYVFCTKCGGRYSFN